MDRLKKADWLRRGAIVLLYGTPFSFAPAPIGNVQLDHLANCS